MSRNSEAWAMWIGGETPEGVTDAQIRDCCQTIGTQYGSSRKEIADAAAACIDWRDTWSASPSR